MASCRASIASVSVMPVHDGPPFDAEQFSSAFENALGETETLLATSSTNQGGELEPTIPENLGNNDADRNEEQPSALTQITLTQVEEVVDPNNETSNERNKDEQTETKNEREECRNKSKQK